MSYGSESVKRWRERTKKRIVDSMGGKCAVCFYYKSLRALDLHHIDPNQKEFGMGHIMAQPIGWKKLIVELRKCVLLCCRCHQEVHDGITRIPDNYPRFNEKYAIYKEPNIIEYDECPICHGKKNSDNKTCSYSCAAKLSRKVNWDNVDLKSLLEQKLSYNKIGKMLNVSGTAVKKRAKKLGLLNSLKS